MSECRELIKALRRIEELCNSEEVGDDIYCDGGYGYKVGQAFGEIDDLVKAQLAKLEKSE